MGRRELPKVGGWLTVAEVAGRLKVCNATIYKLVDVGFLPHTRLGNSIRIAEAAPAPERVPVSFGASALEALEAFVWSVRSHLSTAL